MINHTKKNRDVVPLIQMWCEMIVTIFEIFFVKCGICPSIKMQLNYLQKIINLQAGYKNHIQIPSKLPRHPSTNALLKCLSVQ